jgi:YHS domain-containing protein
MRRAAFLLLLIAVPGCRRAEPPKPHATRTDIKTIDAADPRPVILDPPPVLPDEAAAPKPKDAVAAQNMVPLTEQDEQVRAKLPFAPAIGLDPVDGSKISIRATTPTVDMKNRVFYFSSEANKQLFLANPAQYMKGIFK